MPERMLPFTYRRKLGRDAYVRRVEKLLDLRRTAESVRAQRHPCTVPALRKFAAHVLPKDLYAYVKERRGLGLTAEARRRLAEPVAITRYEFDSASGLRIVMDLAARNEVPVFGADIWLRQRVAVFGGFITIVAVDRHQLDWAVARLRRSVGVSPPKWR